MDGQMKKGILEMCILHLISGEEMYGYEIIRLTKEAFEDVHEATIYTILRRLHGDGYASTHIGNTSNGPQRKYYSITTLGKQKLDDFIQEWKDTLKAVQILGIKYV